MAKNITIKDIAREAGVSIALVSFVMNNRIEADGKQKYRVSPSTRDRILEVAARMNYQPSSAARMLRKGRTHVIGVILSDMGNIFYGTIAKELEKIATLNNYTLLFGSSEEDPERFCRLVKSFMEKDVEGFIVVPTVGSGSCMQKLMDSGVPFVVIDRYHPDYNVPTVVTDNSDATRLAVQDLQKQGAKKICMASYAMRISSMTDRENRFRDLLGDDAPIFNMGFSTVDADADRVADEIIAGGYDGVIGASNILTVALLKSLMRKGVKVQEDVKIVSFDFSNVYGIFNPPIRYVLQPLSQIASESAEFLFYLIEKKQKGEDISGIKDKIILKASLRND